MSTTKPTEIPNSSVVVSDLVGNKTEASGIYHTRFCQNFPENPTFVDRKSLTEDMRMCKSCRGETRKDNFNGQWQNADLNNRKDWETMKNADRATHPIWWCKENLIEPEYSIRLFSKQGYIERWGAKSSPWVITAKGKATSIYDL